MNYNQTVDMNIVDDVYAVGVKKVIQQIATVGRRSSPAPGHRAQSSCTVRSPDRPEAFQRGLRPPTDHN